MASTHESLGEQMIHCARCGRRTMHSMGTPLTCMRCGTEINLSPAPTEPISGGAAGREPGRAGGDDARHLLPLGRAATVAELCQVASDDAELIVAELQEAPEPDEERLQLLVGRAEQMRIMLRCALRVTRARLDREALETITLEVQS